MDNNLLSGEDLMKYAMGGIDDTVDSPEPAGQVTESKPPEGNEQPESRSVEQRPDSEPRGNDAREPAQATREGSNDPGTKAVDPKGLKPLRENLTDDAGNIYDKQGNLLARAGSERRMFERLTTTREALQHKDAYIQTLEQRVKSFESAPAKKSAVDQAIEQLQFKEPEVLNSLRFTNLWKSNPLNAVAHVLAEARKLGYNDQQINAAIQSYNPATDPAMIQSMVQDAVRPVVERLDANNQPKPSQDDDLRSEITMVFAKYPGTHVHQADLAVMLRNNPSLSLEAAARGLMAYAEKHGLDYSQPLRPQIEARNQPSQQPRNNEPPMPGRGPTEVTGSLRSSNSSPFAEPDVSYKDIVSDVLRSTRRT